MTGSSVKARRQPQCTIWSQQPCLTSFLAALSICSTTCCNLPLTRLPTLLTWFVRRGTSWYHSLSVCTVLRRMRVSSACPSSAPGRNNNLACTASSHMDPSLAYSLQGCVATPPADGPNDNCRVSAWSEWSGCHSPCGFGKSTRVRYQTAPALGTGLCAPLVEEALCDYRCGYCGDGQCLAEETCNDCPQDCGPCQPPGLLRECVDEGVYALAFDDGPSPSYVDFTCSVRWTGLTLHECAQHSSAARYSCVQERQGNVFCDGATAGQPNQRPNSQASSCGGPFHWNVSA